MPTNTYEALRTTTIETAVPSVTFDLSTITGYTDLVIISSVQNVSSASTISARYNGDTGSNYSFTYLIGDGNTPISGRAANQTFAVHGYANNSEFATSITQINNYSNSTTFKTIFDRRGTTTNFTGATISTWRNTNAITSILLYNETGVNFAVGSTFTVYGIAASAVTPAPKAIGGSIYSDSTYYYHAFGSTGVFTPTQSISADILVVAGGGAGSIGGGGAGGLLAFGSQSLTATNYTVTVGGGGTALTNNVTSGSQGTGSQFGALTATVGGGSGGLNDNNTSPATLLNGGSGGGSGGAGGGFAPNGTGTSGQGNNGGNFGGITASPFPGGGGGGAGAVGSNAPATNTGGNGGIGATSSLINAIALATGTGQYNPSNGNYYFAGGGGGGGNGVTFFGQGGFGGGANASNVPVTNAPLNMGGGGGGYNGGLNKGSNGGSGIVVVRYLKA
jgi:hypothetical protein